MKQQMLSKYKPYKGEKKIVLYKRLITDLFVLIAISLIAAGCSGGTQQHVDDGGLPGEEEQKIDDGGLVSVVDTAWELLVIREFDALMAADVDNPAVLELREDGTFSMATGCGELGGTYTLDGEFEVMMTTLVDNCSDAQVAQALAVENLMMQNTTSYSVEGETLTIAIDGDNDATFELLQKIDDGGLTGKEGQKIDDGGLVSVVDTAWGLLVIREFDALMAADVDNPAVLELREDGTFYIATGCGEQGGTYTLDGESITFEVMMTTSVVHCSDAQVAQALAVENLMMQNTTSYSVEGETLIIAIDGDNDATFELLQKP